MCSSAKLERVKYKKVLKLTFLALEEKKDRSIITYRVAPNFRDAQFLRIGIFKLFVWKQFSRTKDPSR